MAKDKEDNRDIFDKIFDYAPAVGGAVVGSALGYAGGKRFMRGNNFKGMKPTKKLEQAYKDRASSLRSNKTKSTAYNKAYMDAAGDYDQIATLRLENRAIPLVSTGVGGYAGALTASPAPSKKRRK